MYVLCKRLILIALCFTTTVLFIQTTLPTHVQASGTFNLLGHFDGEIEAVLFVDSNTAYISMGGMLAIVDVSDPATPTLLGSYNTSGLVSTVQVVGSVAYVADWPNGLVIVDVANPANPVLLGSYNTSGEAFGVQVVGNVAYMADWRNGLVMVDVTDPATPSLLRSYNTYYAYNVNSDRFVEVYGLVHSVQVVGSVAYVVYITSSYNGLMIVDVTDPTNPSQLGSYDRLRVDGNTAELPIGVTNGWAYDVQVVGNVAYVVDRPNGLVTVDVTDSAAPSHLGSYDTPSYDDFGLSNNVVQVVGSVAYIANKSTGLIMVDVTDPANPLPLGSYDTDGVAHSVQVVDDVIYVASGSGGLYMLEYVSDPISPLSISINQQTATTVSQFYMLLSVILGTVILMTHRSRGGGS